MCVSVHNNQTLGVKGSKKLSRFVQLLCMMMESPIFFTYNLNIFLGGWGFRGVSLPYCKERNIHSVITHDNNNF